MNTKIFLIIGIFAIITIIPTADAQLSLGGSANQLIEMKIDTSQIIHVKHIVSSSNMPVNVNLFDGTISNFSIINEEGNDIEGEIGKVNDEIGNQTIMIFPSKQNSIIEYNLEDVFTLNDNMWTTKISYPQKITARGTTRKNKSTIISI